MDLLCSKCESYKNPSCFSNYKKSHWCKSCFSEYHKIRDQKRKKTEKLIISIKFCKKCGEEKSVDMFTKCSTSIDNFSTLCKECQANNRKSNIKLKLRRIKNKDKINLKRRENRKKPEVKQKNKIKRREYLEKNREKVRERKRRNHKNKLKNNKNYRIKYRLRKRIEAALDKRGIKSDKTMNYLGCDVIYFREYLSLLFQEGMSWENYGFGSKENPREIYWVMDHIIPCASFDLSDEFQQHICFHHTNNRPLWNSDNVKKSDSLPKNFDFEQFIKLIEELYPQKQLDKDFSILDILKKLNIDV